MKRSSPLTVLYVGSFADISTSRLRADALRDIGLRIEPIESDVTTARKNIVFRAANRLFGFPFFCKAVSRRLVDHAEAIRPDIIWCDKALFIDRTALAAVRRIGNPLLVHYNPDDPFGRSAGFWSVFIAAIPAYDVHLVPRQENIAEYQARGAARVIPFDRGFCLRTHRPPSRFHPRWGEFAAPVSFTGSYEEERSASIGRLISAGIDVAIRGDLWNRAPNWPHLRRHFRGRAVGGEEYALAIGAPQIALHFLRHANRDEQDSRTFEIPACGGFMMAEWSPRHAELFKEDHEAVFFRSDDDLLAKVKHYLARPDECAVIAARGRARALDSGYDYNSRMLELLTKAMQAAGRDDLLERLSPGVCTES